MITGRCIPFSLAIYALLVGWIGWTLCPNRTEIGHMGATVYFWNSLRFDVFHVNPPLTRMVTGLPVVLCHPRYDWDSYSSQPQDRSEWVIGTAFIAANRPEKIHWCFALARWSLIPLLLLGAYFGYHLCRDIYGDSAGFIFLILWCFSPLILAWGGTICPDAVAAALGILAVYAFRQWLHQPTWTRAALTGVCLGLLPLTKLTWILAFAIWPLIWCCWTVPGRWRKAGAHGLPTPPLRQLLVVLLLGLYALNAGYLFDGTCRPLGQFAFLSQSLRGQATPGQSNRFAGTWLGAIPIPLPADLVQGIDTQRLDFERGMPSYLRGEWSEHGWWYYYLCASAVKMPLGTWCLVLLALGVTLFRKGYNAAWRDEMVVLLPLLTLLVFASSQTGFSAHTRYVIPALPLLFLWLSKVGRAFVLGHRSVAILTIFSLAWMVLSSLWIYPHSLSYFNELAGGPKNGAKHLLGSNLDWGQDLFYLEKWSETHPNARPLRVAYSGMYPLERTKVKSAGKPFMESGRGTSSEHASTAKDLLEAGWYALSVNEIYGASRRYRCFLEFEPVAMAGYSIYIYHITLGEANRVRRELGLPELPEASKADKTQAVNHAHSRRP